MEFHTRKIIIFFFFLKYVFVLYNLLHARSAFTMANLLFVMSDIYHYFTLTDLGTLFRNWPTKIAVTKKFQWNIPYVFNRARQIFGQCVGTERVKFIKFYIFSFFFFWNPVIYTISPLRNPSSSVIRLREKLLLLSSLPRLS